LAVEYQRPTPQARTEKPIVPLSKLSEFFPIGERWDGRRAGESEVDHRERVVRQRGEWISRYAATMKRGNIACGDDHRESVVRQTEEGASILSGTG
jgi:hypothetical protein